MLKIRIQISIFMHNIRKNLLYFNTPLVHVRIGKTIRYINSLVYPWVSNAHKLFQCIKKRFR